MGVQRSEPEVGTMQHRVLKVLRRAGGTGMPQSIILRRASLSNKQDLQSAVYFLRQKGHRIDFSDGRYTIKGQGVSVYKRPEKERPATSGAHVRSVKALPGTVVHLKQVDPRSVESRARAGRDLFIINQGAMHRALSTLPDPARPKLLEFSKRVRDCNQVVREFGKMHEVFKKMQETGLLSCLGQ